MICLDGQKTAANFFERVSVKVMELKFRRHFNETGNNKSLLHRYTDIILPVKTYILPPNS